MKKSPTGSEGNVKDPSSLETTKQSGGTDSEWLKLGGMSLLQSDTSCSTDKGNSTILNK
jgi:hypothetical protein